MSIGNGKPAPLSSERFAGTVKWFNEEKGYGFLTRPGADKDIFLHAKALPDGVSALDDGQAVTFQVEQSAKGLRAVNVILCK